MGAYIINIPDSVDRVIYTNVDPMNGKTYIASYSVDDLTPYTGPDLEQVRKKAYQKGYETGYEDGYNEPGKNQQEAYQRGLADAWGVCKKIGCYEIDGGYPATQMLDLFDRDDLPKILSDYTAAEAIEKIQQYEQEKDRQARIEYNFDEIKDVLETTAKECNVSLDEIAEVLQKMKESDNG